MIHCAQRHGVSTGARWLAAALLAASGAALAQAPPAPAASAASAVAAQAQSAAEQAVREHFQSPGNRIEVAAVPLNARLLLTACAAPLSASVAATAKVTPRQLVQVKCPQGDGWTARVAVKLQVFRSVLVAARPLSRGDGPAAADVRSEERDITALGYGYLESLEQLEGRSLSRALAAGSVLTPASLGGRRMVRAGDRVQMIARVDGIEVRADGIALGSGDNGARLRVRNDSSGKVVDGMISGPGEVVALP